MDEFSVMPSAPIGTDGTSFELAVGNPFFNARIHWWCDLSQAWEQLQPSVAELERLFKVTRERNSARQQLTGDQLGNG